MVYNSRQYRNAISTELVKTSGIMNMFNTIFRTVHTLVFFQICKIDVAKVIDNSAVGDMYITTVNPSGLRKVNVVNMRIKYIILILIHT